MANYTEQPVLSFQEQAKFKALFSVPATKIGETGREEPLTAPEIVAYCETIYQWIIKK